MPPPPGIKIPTDPPRPDELTFGFVRQMHDTYGNHYGYFQIV